MIWCVTVTNVSVVTVITRPNHDLIIRLTLFFNITSNYFIGINIVKGHYLRHIL